MRRMFFFYGKDAVDARARGKGAYEDEMSLKKMSAREEKEKMSLMSLLMR